MAIKPFKHMFEQSIHIYVLQQRMYEWHKDATHKGCQMQGLAK